MTAQAPDLTAPTSASAAPSLAELSATVAQLAARVAALEAAQHGAQPVAPVTAVVAAPVAAPRPAPVDAQAEVRQLLEQLFAVALATDPQDDEAIANQFELFRTLVHSDRQGSPVLDTDLRRYKWRPLIGRFGDYLFTADQPASFQIERMIPERLDARTETVKVHLAVRGGRRMAPPITLKRDPRFAGALRIEQMSL